MLLALTTSRMMRSAHLTSPYTLHCSGFFAILSSQIDICTRNCIRRDGKITASVTTSSPRLHECWDEPFQVQPASIQQTETMWSRVLIRIMRITVLSSISHGDNMETSLPLPRNEVGVMHHELVQNIACMWLLHIQNMLQLVYMIRYGKRFCAFMYYITVGYLIKLSIFNNLKWKFKSEGEGV